MPWLVFTDDAELLELIWFAISVVFGSSIINNN